GPLKQFSRQMVCTTSPRRCESNAVRRCLCASDQLLNGAHLQGLTYDQNVRELRNWGDRRERASWVIWQRLVQAWAHCDLVARGEHQDVAVSGRPSYVRARNGS